MPASTRTSPRPAGRFPRSSPTTGPSGRFPRSTPTTGPSGRFPRSTQALRRRREPEPTGLKKLTSAIQPGAAARKVTPSSKKGKAGGLALAAAAAGMLFKNRDKLSGMRQAKAEAAPSTNNASPPPATPTV